MGVLYNPQIITNGLVLYYDAGNLRSYPGSGTVWTDLIGARTANLINGPTFVTSSLGAIVFDGSNDYVTMPNVIDTNATFTFEFWAQSNSDTTPTLMSGLSSGHLQIRISTTALSLVKALILELGNFGSSSATALNTMHHIVLTRSGTTFTCYINGDRKGTLTVNESFNTDNVTLGINSGPGEPFTGRIARFSYYNIELSAREVLQNFNALRSRFGV